MSNHLSVRRVKFQDINKDGSPDGQTTFGVIASDSYEQASANHFSSLEELNAAVDEAGDLLTVADDGHGFDGFDRSKIGTEKNFYGPFCTGRIRKVMENVLFDPEEQDRRDHKNNLFGPDPGEPK